MACAIIVQAASSLQVNAKFSWVFLTAQTCVRNICECLITDRTQRVSDSQQVLNVPPTLHQCCMCLYNCPSLTDEPTHIHTGYQRLAAQHVHCSKPAWSRMAFNQIVVCIICLFVAEAAWIEACSTCCTRTFAPHLCCHIGIAN